MSLYRLRDFGVDIAGRKLVQNVDLEVLAGACTTIVGASGSGKSLTCLAPFGLSPATISGRVTLDGIDLTEAGPRQLRRARSALTGFVFQQPLSALTPHLAVGAQLQEAAMQAGAARPTRRALSQMLERVGLSRAEERLDQFPHLLSGGERQRVMIAAAIAHHPKLLVADEPTSALDAALRREITDLLRTIMEDEGLGLLLVSHDLAGVEDIATGLVVMESGRVVETGPAKSVLSCPQQDYTRRLLAATPRLSDPAPHLPEAGEGLLEIECMSVSFARPGWRHGRLAALQDVSLSLRKGEALAVVGGSGSGKSTLGRAIAGLGPVTTGTMRWRDQPLPAGSRRDRAMRAAIQPVFQDPVASLDPRWRVDAIIDEPLRYLHPQLDKAARDQKISAMLAAVQLDDGYRTRQAATLSGGQAQRVAIARALITEAELLVLDEATSALDPLVAGEILKLLAHLQRDLGLSIIFISHDIAAARRLCHRIAVLEAGKLAEVGAAEEIIRSPQSEYTKRLIAASV